MLKPLYIKSATAISPQQTFTGVALQPMLNYEGNRLSVIDQDYTKYISPVAIRRMSRLLKMGISAGMKSLQEAGVTCPDGIITGTGHGSTVDMEHFLHDMIGLNEETLNPTYFIQSTYNSINGWLAMQSKCMGYNQTFVHRGFSLELALLDAQLLLSEASDTQNYLVGCYDEVTDEYLYVRGKAGYWKKEPVNSLELLKHDDTTGTIAGEGTAFFTVTNDKEHALCSIKEIVTLHSSDPDGLADTVKNLLERHSLTEQNIDVLLSGINGDSTYKGHYDEIINIFPTTTTVCGFKHLCGDYDTVSGFALWLMTHIYSQQQLPPEIVIKQGGNQFIRRILYVNHSTYGNKTVMLAEISS